MKSTSLSLAISAAVAFSAIVSYCPLQDKKEKKLVLRDSVIIKSGDFGLVIVQRPFVEGAHKVTRDSKGNVTLIDGKHPYGTDGPLPLNEIETMFLIHDSVVYSVPSDLWADCYNLRLGKLSSNGFSAIVTRQGSFRVKSLSSDGAGGYIVEWDLFIDGKNSTRTITYPD